eukprot:1158940-Pelagomonas_calceolata.AAC.7
MQSVHEDANKCVTVLELCGFGDGNSEFIAVHHSCLEWAKTTVLTRHESDLKDNVYWLGLLTHLLNPHVPYKNIECLRDLKAL